MDGLISLQHEVRAGYRGCHKCGKRHYPYYEGSDKNHYCEDCACALVKAKQGQFGKVDIDLCPRCKGTGRK